MESCKTTYRLTPQRSRIPKSGERGARNWFEEILFQNMAILDVGRACRAPLRHFVWRRKRERWAHSGVLHFADDKGCRVDTAFGNENARYWGIYKDTWSVNFINRESPARSPRFLARFLSLGFSTSFPVTYDIAVSLVSMRACSKDRVFLPFPEIRTLATSVSKFYFKFHSVLRMRISSK
ncbi:hypothetical protein K0M31_020322 [Melipona bicolor]|uniref:Uncharacterized protein n=1 Tax=Melipona bicolor TaxID=60889 RepID=A0AA40KQP5_9HYME|nr:hypothetical protein K0M31_020322 [Melipona bicolor]